MDFLLLWFIIHLLTCVLCQMSYNYHTILVGACLIIMKFADHIIIGMVYVDCIRLYINSLLVMQLHHAGQAITRIVGLEI